CASRHSPLAALAFVPAQEAGDGASVHAHAAGGLAVAPGLGVEALRIAGEEVFAGEGAGFVGAEQGSGVVGGRGLPAGLSGVEDGLALGVRGVVAAFEPDVADGDAQLAHVAGPGVVGGELGVEEGFGGVGHLVGEVGVGHAGGEEVDQGAALAGGVVE